MLLFRRVWKESQRRKLPTQIKKTLSSLSTFHPARPPHLHTYTQQRHYTTHHPAQEAQQRSKAETSKEKHTAKSQSQSQSRIHTYSTQSSGLKNKLKTDKVSQEDRFNHHHEPQPYRIYGPVQVGLAAVAPADRRRLGGGIVSRRPAERDVSVSRRVYL